MSSGSESDEDYVPKEPEHVSEEESGDEEIEEHSQSEIQQKGKKRKAVPKKGKRKKVINSDKDLSEKKEPVEKIEEVKDLEEEKKREEDLWAKFLEGTDTKPKPNTTNSRTEMPLSKYTLESNKSAPSIKAVNKNTENNKEREKRIFEFAGETIVVEDNVIKEKIKASESSSSIKSIPSQSRTPGGLSNILGQLNKKNKLSTLEKSKLDWDTYKKAEDIDDEIQSHNKGKQGYLERQDFLERADLRQYEIERDLRINKRSNR